MDKDAATSRVKKSLGKGPCDALFGAEDKTDLAEAALQNVFGEAEDIPNRIDHAAVGPAAIYLVWRGYFL